MTAKYNQRFPILMIISLIGTHYWIICSFKNSLLYHAQIIITKTLNFQSPAKLAFGPCIFICLPRVIDERQSLPHISHLNGFSLLCDFMWSFGIPFVSNYNLQPGQLHTWTSRPMCQRLCALSCKGILNTFPHTGSWHLWPKLFSHTHRNFHFRGKAYHWDPWEHYISIRVRTRQAVQIDFSRYWILTNINCS